MANAVSSAGGRRGIRTYALLVLAMALVIVIVTSLCLLLIRHRLRTQVSNDLSRDLAHSVAAFQNLQAERLGALDRENSLLAVLPPLKALMTSGDVPTIQNGAAEFWQISGADLFALADGSGRIVALYTRTRSANPAALRTEIGKLLGLPHRTYLIDGASLYACSLRPLYFGSAQNGTLLGYVVSGISTDRTAREISEPTGVSAAFISSGKIVASTLDPDLQAELMAKPMSPLGAPPSPVWLKLGNARFLAASQDLSQNATAPLQLTVLKSFEPAEQSIRRIDRVVLSASLIALLCGAALMITLSRVVTRPLEELSRGVRAFAAGDVSHKLPSHGTREVRELSAAFAGMRAEIQQANRALLESERLATIGSMASSVSHDFRHYLATIYANSEFLASERLSVPERAEILGEIRGAVLGTTDMIESLLIFSRTGASLKRSPQLVAPAVERAVSLIRVHPDAEGVTVQTRGCRAEDTAAVVDGKQIERAVFNLLLNACQSVRAAAPAERLVTVTLEAEEAHVIVQVSDNGPGVPEKIRNSLFQPFVSEGKQKGTGLGLTLAHCIAAEHGGEVVLLRSLPGETIFQMTLARALRPGLHSVAPIASSPDQVVPDENVRT
ncbi:MAG TPA: HAMP domain-containing sensor histidine kinase [Acidobacteriaceae bacterium]|jgi:signal transduction histidine kinase|nr:HAMP domain-containing sensor histidine kinase [Acidobacteriaceae bacterium]